MRVAFLEIERDLSDSLDLYIIYSVPSTIQREDYMQLMPSRRNSISDDHAVAIKVKRT